MTGHPGRTYTRAVMLPAAPDLDLLLVRTDYSDDRPLEPHAEDLVALAREDYLSLIAVADAQTIRDHTVLFVDFNELSEQVGRTFRSIPSEVEPIVASLPLANMDFVEFADNADSDGIFLGF